MSHLISAFWRWGLRNWKRSFAHGAELDTPSLWDRGLISGSPRWQLQRPPSVNLPQSCGGFPLAALSSDAVGNRLLLWILQSQTDQRSPEVEVLDSFIAPGWLFIHWRFHPGQLQSRFAGCLVETFKGTSLHFLKENCMKTVLEEGSEQISYSIVKWTGLLIVTLEEWKDGQDIVFHQTAGFKGRFQCSYRWCF